VTEIARQNARRAADLRACLLASAPLPDRAETADLRAIASLQPLGWVSNDLQ
jgi:hypothetical protein